MSFKDKMRRLREQTQTQTQTSKKSGFVRDGLTGQDTSKPPEGNNPGFVGQSLDTFKDFGSAVAGGARKFGADIRKIQTGRLDEGNLGLLGRTTERLNEVSSDVRSSAEAEKKGEIGTIRNQGQEAGLVLGAVGDIFGDVAGSAIKTVVPDNIEQDFKTVSGQVGEKVGDTAIGKKIGSELGEAVEGYNYLEENDPNKYRDYKSAIGAAEFGANLLGYGTASKTAKTAGRGFANSAESAAETAASAIGSAQQTGRATGGFVKDKIPSISDPKKGFQDYMENKADDLSTNYNRMNARQIRQFKKETGVSPGKFLNDRGITETGDELVDKLQNNMKASRDQADEAIESIEGNYRAPTQEIATSKRDKRTGEYKTERRDPVHTMLLDNLENASSRGKSKDSKRMKKLIEKYEREGLSLKEINEGKRYMNANNEFNYFTDDTSSKKGFITQLDSDVRNFLFDTAKAKGVTGIDDINRQTKAYYKLMEGIGQWQDKIEGNNEFGLTDYLAFTADPLLFAGKQVAETGFFKKKRLDWTNKLSGREQKPEIESFRKTNRDKDGNNMSSAISVLPTKDSSRKSVVSKSQNIQEQKKESKPISKPEVKLNPVDKRSISQSRSDLDNKAIVTPKKIEVAVLSDVIDVTISQQMKKMGIVDGELQAEIKDILKDIISTKFSGNIPDNDEVMSMAIEATKKIVKQNKK